MQSNPKKTKMPTIVSILYFFIFLLPDGALQPSNFFLLRSCRIYNLIYFSSRLPLSNPGPDGEINALPGRRLLLSSGPNVADSLLLEILNKILQNTLSFLKTGKRQHCNKFIGLAAGGKAADGAKVFIYVYSHRVDDFLCRIVTHAGNDCIQICQSKSCNAVIFT